VTFEPLTPERRRQQTREHLLQAATRVFAERGFHGASLDDVAAAAGFTKGAVYSNFKSKEDLFLAILESRYERAMNDLHATLETSESWETNLSDFVALVRSQFEEAGIDEWTALYQEFCLYALRNPAARRGLAKLNRLDVESVAGIIERERKRHDIRVPETPQQAAQIVVALMNGLFVTRAIDPEAVDESFLESVIAFLARSLTFAPTPPTQDAEKKPPERAEKNAPQGAEKRGPASPRSRSRRRSGS
jgi:AcrR family transcriptional regulator